MTTLHQPLRIDDIARHAGYSKWHLQRAVFQYKGESLGRYIRERKLLLAARDLRDTDQRVYDICLKYGFDSQQTFTVFTRTFNLPPGAYRKENLIAPTEARALPGLALSETSDTPSAAPDTQWRPVPEPQTKQHRIKLVEIHHMECLNQLLRQRQPSDGAGNSRQESRPGAGSGVFILPSNSAGISYNQG